MDAWIEVSRRCHTDSGYHPWKILNTMSSHCQPWIMSKLLRRWWHIRRKIRWSRNTCSSLLLEHCPVEGVVVLVVECPEEDPEELAQVHVVRRLFEPQAAAVVEVHCKLSWETLAQHLDTAFTYGGILSSQERSHYVNWSNWISCKASTLTSIQVI